MTASAYCIRLRLPEPGSPDGRRGMCGLGNRGRSGACSDTTPGSVAVGDMEHMQSGPGQCQGESLGQVCMKGRRVPRFPNPGALLTLSHGSGALPCVASLDSSHLVPVIVKPEHRCQSLPAVP